MSQPSFMQKRKVSSHPHLKHLGIGLLLLLFLLPSISIASNAQSSAALTGSSIMTIKSPVFAGYIALGNSSNNYLVSAAYGIFSQPTVTCNSLASGSQGVAFSVILVNGSGPVAFAGTAAMCFKGASSPIYFAVLGNTFPQMTVHPGDVFATSVRISAGYEILSLTDLSTGESSQAQVIIGNPGPVGAGFVVLHTAPARLAQFTPISFTSYATINGTTKGVGGFSSSEAMVLKGILTNDKVTRVVAVPSSLSQGGTDFTVTWIRAK